MQTATFLFLAFIIVQRLSELVIAKINTKRLLARGAYEVGARHYPVMVAMHSIWIGCLLFFGYSESVSYGWLVVFAVLQMLRIWILGTLGARWTTRIIILREPLVVRGPFRFLKHPNGRNRRRTYGSGSCLGRCGFHVVKCRNALGPYQC
jgi:methyltransferase